MTRNRIVRHGTSNEYHNHGCRCDACRKAHMAYMRERGWAGYAKDACPSCGKPKRVRAQMCAACYTASVTVPHGTENAAKRCQCDVCRAAASAARNARRRANLEAANAYQREYRRRKGVAA
jgi:hypothetical protein